jgi:hypothetical protein
MKHSDSRSALQWVAREDKERKATGARKRAQKVEAVRRRLLPDKHDWIKQLNTHLEAQGKTFKWRKPNAKSIVRTTYNNLNFLTHPINQQDIHDLTKS